MLSAVKRLETVDKGTIASLFVLGTYSAVNLILEGNVVGYLLLPAIPVAIWFYIRDTAAYRESRGDGRQSEIEEFAE